MCHLILPQILTTMSNLIAEEVATRRTFAIISHPDAGKTTITEKLLLFGQAIQTAGSVKGKKGDKKATSDWMSMEQQRGISVTSSVMQFPYQERTVNLLDTPGHEDFSEDTYRTLTAVDSVLMVIDGAKGVEDRTVKLMEVCRLRDTPIFTFVNKMDREVREQIEVLDEVEDVLNIACAPITWPISMGKRFKGVYNLYTDTLHVFTPGQGHTIAEDIQIAGLESDEAAEFLGELLDELKGESYSINAVNEILEEIDKDHTIDKSDELIKFTNKFIKKISNNLENFNYNIIVANLHEMHSFLSKEIIKGYQKKTILVNYEKILITMMPILPHLSNECFESIREDKVEINWPKFDEKYIKEEASIVVIQINGKKRGLVNAKLDLLEDEIMKLIKDDKNLNKYLVDKEIKKKIYIKNKLINIII